MKHLLKTYEHEGITCDMRNSRKSFFPVMLDDKKIADVEKSLNHVDNLNINILESLDKDTYNNLFELLSQITNENKIKTISFSSTKKFSRYRRKREDDGEYMFFADNRSLTLPERDIFRCVNGNFMIIKFQGCDKLINRETYRKLLENKIDIEHRNDSYLPRMLLGGETVDTHDKLVYFYIDDFSKLNDVKFIIDGTDIIAGDEKEDDETVCELQFTVDNIKHDGKIILPKVESKHNQKITFYFTLKNAQTGESIEFKKEDLDFRNFPNVLDVDDPEDGFFTFTADLEPEHKNELSL